MINSNSFKFKARTTEFVMVRQSTTLATKIRSTRTNRLGCLFDSVCVYTANLGKVYKFLDFNKSFNNFGK